jgi:MoxR-like ATPase
MAQMSRSTFWWVNQGKTYADELAGGFVWAPQADKNGKQQFHWSNVSRIRSADVLFHYANGNVRAVSLARSSGREGQRPSGLPSEPWNSLGWIADCEYSELAKPLALEQVADSLRKLKLSAGPINSTGKVNQGYLFRLSEEAATIIAAQLDLATLPQSLQDLLRPLASNRWDSFIYWAKRFWQPSVRDEERSYKLLICKRLTEAREAVLAGHDDWLAVLQRAFSAPNNLTHHIQESKLLDWCSGNKEAAAELLRQIWNSEPEHVNAITRFCEGFPRDVISGTGTRLNMASFLAMERDPNACPIYRSEAFEMAYRMTGYSFSHTNPETETGTYEKALAFLDRLISEAAKRELVLDNRLDAQSVLWCVTKYEPPKEWSEDDRERLQEFRNGRTPVVPLSGIDALADKLLLDRRYLKEIERLLEAKGQVIFYGPPGTGKTYVALELAKYFAGDAERVRIVQFHPSFTYEDFVEGYRPCLRDGRPGFRLVRGPLLRIAAAATEAPEKIHVLLIDEINRGNVAKVFGELYFLLEYRDHELQLQYSPKTQFTLPRNLWVIGTMNTADRSIALMDAALRRRFFFIPFFPSEPPIEGLLRRWLERNHPELLWVADIVDTANGKLGDRHAAIGPSYFMREDLDASWAETIWKHAVIPYLAEQLFGEEDRLKEFELNVLRNPGIADSLGETVE